MKNSDKKSTEISERQLIVSLQAGNENAMHTLYDMYKRGLFYYSYQITKHQAESEDIVTDSFIKYCMAKELYYSMLEIKNFLYITVRNASFNYLKIQANRSRIIAEHIQPFLKEKEDHPSSELIRAELISLFNRAMEQLNESQRNVVDKLIFENKTVKEVAMQLNISEANVWQTKSRAVKVLKSYVTSNRSKEYLLIILLKIFDLQE